jgi:predicted Zn-ribbon and HTH transcriptional regulator
VSKILNLKNLRRRYSIMADKTLQCKDCGAEFVFTEGEQAFYAEKGFTNEPQRCPACRKARKEQRKNNYNN